MANRGCSDHRSVDACLVREREGERLIVDDIGAEERGVAISIRVRIQQLNREVTIRVKGKAAVWMLAVS